MKSFLVIAAVLLIGPPAKNCNHKKIEALVPGCYKGKLEVKGGCMNYTISIISKGFDSSLVVANWKDETTGKDYKNVFALNSRCTFPPTIKEGDEFYFVLDSTTVQNCAVCMMYYPAPPKKISIKVIAGPCSP